MRPWCSKNSTLFENTTGSNLSTTGYPGIRINRNTPGSGMEAIESHSSEKYDGRHVFVIRTVAWHTYTMCNNWAILFIEFM